MLKQLRPEDANAVDLLLNTAHGHDGKALAVSFVHHSSAGASNGRLACVEKLLKVLDEMPESEPSDDLVAMTLARIENAVYGGEAGAAIRPPAIQSLAVGELPLA